MFRFRSFRIFCEKIAIFRTFDHWSEILSMSAGRPLGQGVCPPLPATTDVRGPVLQWTMRLTTNQKIAGTVNTLTVWVTNCMGTVS